LEVPISGVAAVISFFVYGVPADGKNDLLVGLLNSELQAAAALLGIVLAALAVIVAFLGDAYLTFLTSNADDPSRDPDYEELHRLVFVFWFTCVASVLAVLACSASVWLLTRAVDPRLITAASTFFFLWALLACLGLVRFVAQHLLFRTAHGAIEKRRGAIGPREPSRARDQT
jgi:hypothetical protein